MAAERPRGHSERESPLQTALEAYYARMPSYMKRKHIGTLWQAFEKAIPTHGSLKVVDVATACSGSDIAVICLEFFLWHLRNRFGISMSASHVFAAEKDPAKQGFLRSQFDPRFLFSDVADLSRKCAMNLMTHTSTAVPRCFFVMAGFSCKSRSSLNVRAAANKDCMQRQDLDMETSATFESIFAYITKAFPPMLLLENVTALCEKGVDSAQSDAEWLMSRLRQSGYYVKIFRFDADNYGSPASRLRLYFIAWLLFPGVPLEDGSPALKAITEATAWLDSFMETFCIDPLPSEEFIATEPGLLAQFQDMAEQSAEPSAKQAKKDTCWQNDHCDEFRGHGLAWPPDLSKGSLVIQELAHHGTRFERGCLSDRAAELLFFIHTKFPFGGSAVGSGIEFVDVNPSISRVLATEGRSPWRQTAPTLTGQALLCVRYRCQSDGLVHVRPATGTESFQMIGWDHTFFSQGRAMTTHSLLSNMSGNAFSAFAVLPMLMVAFSGLGVVSSLQLSEAEAAKPASIQAGLDAYSDGEACSSSESS